MSLDQLRDSLWEDHDFLVRKKQKLEGFNNCLNISKDERGENIKEIERLKKEIQRIEEELNWV